jgi:hypothetical protein
MLHRVIEVGNVELLQQTCEYFGTGDVRACKTGTERNRTPVYTKPDGRVVVIFDKRFSPLCRTVRILMPSKCTAKRYYVKHPLAFRF